MCQEPHCLRGISWQTRGCDVLRGRDTTTVKFTVLQEGEKGLWTTQEGVFPRLWCQHFRNIASDCSPPCCLRTSRLGRVKDKHQCQSHRLLWSLQNWGWKELFQHLWWRGEFIAFLSHCTGHLQLPVCVISNFLPPASWHHPPRLAQTQLYSLLKWQDVRDSKSK